MTDQSENPDRLDDTAEEAERIAAAGTDVRERTRDAFVETVRRGRVELHRLGDLAEHMMSGAVDGVKASMPDDPDSVLREVVDGLADGFATSAHATRLALEEARGRGETYAREELDKAADDLKTLQSMFVDVVTRATRRGAEVLSTELKDVSGHVERTAEKIGPPVQSALSEAVRHPMKMASETAAAGLRAAPMAAGLLLQTASGLLQGAADLLTGAARSEPKDDADA